MILGTCDQAIAATYDGEGEAKQTEESLGGEESTPTGGGGDTGNSGNPEPKGGSNEAPPAQPAQNEQGVEGKKVEETKVEETKVEETKVEETKVEETAEEVVEGMMEERGEHEHEPEHAEDAGRDHEEAGVEGVGHDHEADHDHGEADDHGHSSHTHSGDSSEEEHEEADEHVWTSPVKAAEITEAIAAKMAEIDPDNAESYTANASAYVEEILKVDVAFREIVDNAERRTIVFGDRFPLRYFAEEYGLEYFAAFPGCSSEAEPSASTLAFLIDKVREERIPVVFSIEFSNGNIARAICESSGAVRRTFNTCHNVTREQMESGATYVSLMTENLGAVREALGDKRAAE